MTQVIWFHGSGPHVISPDTVELHMSYACKSRDWLLCPYESGLLSAFEQLLSSPTVLLKRLLLRESFCPHRLTKILWLFEERNIDLTIICPLTCVEQATMFSNVRRLYVYQRQVREDEMWRKIHKRITWRTNDDLLDLGLVMVIQHGWFRKRNPLPFYQKLVRVRPRDHVGRATEMAKTVLKLKGSDFIWPELKPTSLENQELAFQVRKNQSLYPCYLRVCLTIWAGFRKNPETCIWSILNKDVVLKILSLLRPDDYVGKKRLVLKNPRWAREMIVAYKNLTCFKTRYQMRENRKRAEEMAESLVASKRIKL